MVPFLLLVCLAGRGLEKIGGEAGRCLALRGALRADTGGWSSRSKFRKFNSVECWSANPLTSPGSRAVFFIEAIEDDITASSKDFKRDPS